MILVDESDPIDEVEPTFPYREVNTRRGLKIREAYEVLDEIGRGKFGRVFRCKDRESGLVLAAKVVSTKRKEERRNVEREIEIMKKLQHPRLIQLYDAIEDLANSEMCLVLEMVGGGELFDRVIQDEFVLTERACAVFVRQISEAVEYIHSQNILHLDMKPENVMCLSKKGNRIKIIDFGLARFYDPNKKLQVLFGTPEFVAPEVVNFEAIDYATDMWSVGVITYVLLSGLSPFMGETDVETMANVTIAKYDFDDECFDDISDDAKDFISKLLMKDKKTRLTASECLKHRWLLPRNPDTCPSTPEIPNKPIISTTTTASTSASTSKDEQIVSEKLQPLRTSSPCSELTITDLTPPLCSSPVQITDQDDEKIEVVGNHDDVDSHLIELPSASTPTPVCNSSTGDQSESESGYSGSGHSDDARQNSNSIRPAAKIPTERKIQNSLELTKDNLRDFVARWTDTPYLFDSPKGIITHLCTETERNLADSESSNVQHHYRIPPHSHSQSNLPHENSFECGINIVNQIRRFSYQLHEELQLMKNQCNKSLRKCSWSEVSVNAQ